MHLKEFSKIIVAIVLIVWILSLIFSFIMIWKIGDLSPLGYIIPSIEATTAVCLGFYFNKAKNENVLKNMKKYSLDKIPDFDINKFNSN